MKKTWIVIGIFLLTGCSAAEVLRDNYLGGKKDSVTGQEIIDTYKYDYLGTEYPVIDKETKDRFIFMAQEKLMDSPYKEIYDILSISFDEDVKMMDAFPYAFIHFSPKQEQESIAHGTTYMVVIKLLEKQVVYADIFKPSGGDPVYKYREILQLIKKKMP